MPPLYPKDQEGIPVSVGQEYPNGKDDDESLEVLYDVSDGDKKPAALDITEFIQRSMLSLLVQEQAEEQENTLNEADFKPARSGKELSDIKETSVATLPPCNHLNTSAARLDLDDVNIVEVNQSPKMSSPSSLRKIPPTSFFKTSRRAASQSILSISPIDKSPRSARKKAPPPQRAASQSILTLAPLDSSLRLGTKKAPPPPPPQTSPASPSFLKSPPSVSNIVKDVHFEASNLHNRSDQKKKTENVLLSRQEGSIDSPNTAKRSPTTATTQYNCKRDCANSPKQARIYSPTARTSSRVARGAHSDLVGAIHVTPNSRETRQTIKMADLIGPPPLTTTTTTTTSLNRQVSEESSYNAIDRKLAANLAASLTISDAVGHVELGMAAAPNSPALSNRPGLTKQASSWMSLLSPESRSDYLYPASAATANNIDYTRKLTGSSRKGSRFSFFASGQPVTASLVVEETLNDSENTRAERSVVDAEAVIHDHSKRSRRIAIGLGLLATVLLIGFSFAFSIVNNKNGNVKDEQKGMDVDPRCLLPTEEQSALVHCLCYDTPEMLYDSLTEEEVAFYGKLLNLYMEVGLLEENPPAASCSPEHLAIMTQSNSRRMNATADEANLLSNDYLQQSYVLSLMYFSMGGDDWKENTNWLVHGNICTWFGLECGFIGRVYNIRLAANGLIGTIPTQIRYLQNLNSIDLSFNVGIVGVLPMQLAELPRLRDILLNGLALFGTIPSEIGSLGRLDRLELARNSLTGFVPTEILGLEMRTLTLSSNLLNGTIPSEIGGLTNLVTLRMDHNLFSGTLPSHVEKLSKLELLDISRNSLSGTIPDWFGSNSNLEVVDLIKSGLMGMIPETYCNNSVPAASRVIVGNCLGDTVIVPNCTCCNASEFVLSWCIEYLPLVEQNV
jgi:hypothetical protein